MLAPTTIRSRIETLDVLRGVAVLGILLANIPFFAFPAIGNMAAYGSADPGAGWFGSVTLALVTGKFRTMLAILFGAGLYLQYVRRRHDPQLWPGGYLKRTMFLAMLGVIHGCFIWYGDILFLYANIAFLAMWFAHLPDRTLRNTIAICASISILIGLGLGALGTFVPDLAATEPSDVPEGVMQAFFDPATEQALFGSGSYGGQLVFRMAIFAMAILEGFFAAPELLALFLFGILLARARFFERPSDRPKLLKGMLIVGFGVGLPLNLLALLFGPRDVHYMVASTWEMFFGPLLGVGYIALWAMIAERGWLRAVLLPIQRAGQMALTTYLGQSVLCTLFFYSFGFGYFGRLDVGQTYLVVLGVWVIMVAFAAVWLRIYRMGPVEVLWRSATEGKWLPIRRSIPEPASGSAPSGQLPPAQGEVGRPEFDL